MPLYDYECLECGFKFTVLQKLSDEPCRRCSLCGRVGTVKKLPSTPAFKVTGAGAYDSRMKCQ